jgi:alpha-methylacyl-CoA racemase
MAVGALEPRFYREFVTLLGLDPATLPAQHDESGWPVLRKAFTAAFAAKTRDEWTAVFDASDACVTPVLAFGEVAEHPHMAAREVITEVDGIPQPAPAPRLSRTPARTPRDRGPVACETVLTQWRNLA